MVGRGAGGPGAGADIQALTRLAADPSDLRAARRARAVLAVLSGCQASEVAAGMSVSPASISNWRRAYDLEGIEGLRAARPGPGGPSDGFALTDADRADLRRQALSWGGYPAVRRARALLALAAGDSVQAVAYAAGVGVGTVYRWRTHYRRHGVSAGRAGLRPSRVGQPAPDRPRGPGTEARPVVPEPPAPALTLPVEVRRELEVFAKDTSRPSRAVRARIILLRAEGLPEERIAAMTGRSAATLRTWILRFAAHGLRDVRYARESACDRSAR